MYSKILSNSAKVVSQVNGLVLGSKNLTIALISATPYIHNNSKNNQIERCITFFANILLNVLSSNNKHCRVTKVVADHGFEFSD